MHNLSHSCPGRRGNGLTHQLEYFKVGIVLGAIRLGKSMCSESGKKG